MWVFPIAFSLGNAYIFFPLRLLKILSKKTIKRWHVGCYIVCFIALYIKYILHAFLVVCQFYVQFHFSYSTFLKVTLPPFLLFSCILVLGLRKHGDRQECMTCTCLEVSDLSFTLSCTGKQQFFGWCWDASSPLFYLVEFCFIFNPFPYLDCTLFSFLFFLFCSPLGLQHLSSPKNPFCKTLSTSFHSSPSFSSVIKIAPVLTTLCFSLFCFLSGFWFISWWWGGTNNLERSTLPLFSLSPKSVMSCRNHYFVSVVFKKHPIPSSLP